MKLIAYEELNPRWGISLSLVQLRRLWNAGRFPKPIKMGFDRGRIAFIEKEIDDWLAQKDAERAIKRKAPYNSKRKAA